MATYPSVPLKRDDVQPPDPNQATLSGLYALVGLGSSPIARHYLGNHYYFLCLQVLRWFSSLGSRRATYLFSRRRHMTIICRVPPFGYLRIYVSLQLPAAYRSLPRPSSVLST